MQQLEENAKALMIQNVSVAEQTYLGHVLVGITAQHLMLEYHVVLEITVVPEVQNLIPVR